MMATLPENQISASYRYIEKLPTITLKENIADTKWTSQEFWFSDSCTLLEQPCSESSLNFAARASGRKAWHLRLSTIFATSVRCI
jgi:hypothetical protein